MTDQEKTEKRRPVPGQYVGQLVEYAFTKTKDGHPQIVGIFDFKDSTGAQFQQAWFGTFKAGKGREFTMRTLQMLGFDERTMELSSLALGVDSGVLNLNKKVSLTVEDRADQQGEMQSRIAWVNEVGGPLLAKRISQSEAADILNRMSGIGNGFASGRTEEDGVPF